MKQSHKIVFDGHPHNAVVLYALGNSMYYKKRRATHILGRLLETFLVPKSYAKNR